MNNVKAEREKILKQELSDITVCTIAKYLISKHLSDNFRKTLKSCIRDSIRGVEILEGVSEECDAVNKVKVLIPILPPLPCQDYQNLRDISEAEKAYLYRGEQLTEQFFIFDRLRHQRKNFLGNFNIFEVTLSELFDISEPAHTTDSSIKRVRGGGLNQNGLFIRCNGGIANVHILLHYLIGNIKQAGWMFTRLRRVCGDFEDELERICSEQPLLRFPRSITSVVGSDGEVKRNKIKLTLGDVINLINDKDIIGVLTMASTTTTGYGKVSNRFRGTGKRIVNDFDLLINRLTGYNKFEDVMFK